MLWFLSVAVAMDVKEYLTATLNVGQHFYNADSIDGTRYIYIRSTEEILLRLDTNDTDADAVREELESAMDDMQDQDLRVAPHTLRAAFARIMQGEPNPVLDESVHGPIPHPSSFRRASSSRPWIGLDGNTEFSIIAILVLVMSCLLWRRRERHRDRHRQAAQLRFYNEQKQLHDEQTAAVAAAVRSLPILAFGDQRL